jgi:hypothetical protein
MVRLLGLLPSSLLLLLATAASDAQAFSFSLPWTTSATAKPRFKEDALSPAGGLGLEHLEGRVAALGDWNGDQLYVGWSASDRTGMSADCCPSRLGRSIDLFELSKDQRSVSVWTWDHGLSLALV